MRVKRHNPAYMSEARLYGWLVYHTYDSRRCSPGGACVATARSGRRDCEITEEGLMTSATHGLRGKQYQETWMHLCLLQFGMCAICERGIGDVYQKNYGTPITRLVIDHCHKTGTIRALLCSQCNTKVGDVEGGNRAMIAWLRRNGDRLIMPDYLAKIRAYLAYWRDEKPP